MEQDSKRLCWTSINLARNGRLARFVQAQLVRIHCAGLSDAETANINFGPR
jgi:hypothetical protein